MFLLDWIRSFFRRDDRLLFRYSDGIKQRAIDPVAAYRLLWTSPDCDLIKDASMARNPLKEDGDGLYPMQMVYDAEDRLRTMVRNVFGVSEWTETSPGLTVDETDTLLNSFMDFCADIKKKRKPSPTPSVSTESMEPASYSDTADFPAGADPDYCSSANESNVAAPIGP